MSGDSPNTLNIKFSKLASDKQIIRTAQALEGNNIHSIIAKESGEAKRIFFELIPDGAEVFLGASVTMEKLGIRE